MNEDHNKDPHSNCDTKKNREKGFTLIEILAVLVILGILAAVAIPKYFDLQEDARRRAMQGAMAEAVGRLNSKFAKSILAGSQWYQISYTTDSASLGSDMGDFTLQVQDFSGPGTDAASGDTRLTILITGKAGTPVAGTTLSRSLKVPGSI